MGSRIWKRITGSSRCCLCASKILSHYSLSLVITGNSLALSLLDVGNHRRKNGCYYGYYYYYHPLVDAGGNKRMRSRISELVYEDDGGNQIGSQKLRHEG